MKKLLLCLAFLGSFSTPLFANETSQAAKKAAIEEAKAAKKAEKEAEYNMDVHYQPHSMGISYRMGGLNSVGMQTISLDIYTRQRKGKTQYTPMVSIRFNAPFSKNLSGQLSGGLDYWGFLFGGSQYVFDMRSKETGLGWSMLANGGMTFESPTTFSLNNPVSFMIGGEVDFKAIFNFNKYVGATAGFTMGYIISPNILHNKIDHGFIWGFNLGLIF